MCGAVLLVSLVSRITHLSFCGKKYTISDQCVAESKHRIKCDDYEMSWSYAEGTMLEIAAEQAIRTFEQMHHSSQRETITCYLSGQKVNAFKVNTPNQECYILAYGIVNKHSVVVELSLHKEPLTNDHLPETVKKILQLTN